MSITTCPRVSSWDTAEMLLWRVILRGWWERKVRAFILEVTSLLGDTGWLRPFTKGPSWQGLSFLWVLGSTSQSLLASLNPDNPFINLSSITLVSVYLFPMGNLTDVAAPNPLQKMESLQELVCFKTT